MRVLTVNAGSSSLRLRLLDHDDGVLDDAHFEAWSDADDGAVADAVGRVATRVDAIGHRVVHGGTSFAGPVVVTPAVEGAIDALTPLAPLHQPRALAAIRQLGDLLPGVPAVACFDTAFHATLSDAAATYALPAAWRRSWGLRRFGFHGLSHRYASRRAAELLGARLGAAAPDDPRVVVCHLGAGASLCATRAARSVDTTMGFTPFEGLVMATRSGSVDPGLLLWLLTAAGLTAEEVDRGLRDHSGLAGLAGGTGDMRDVVARRAAGDAAAGLAFDVYVHRLVTSIGAMAASLGGLDALVFTGGVGEHQPIVRAEAAERLGFLGTTVDALANQAAAGGDVDVSGAGASVAVFVIEAREDVEVARSVRSIIDLG